MMNEFIPKLESPQSYITYTHLLRKHTHNTFGKSILLKGSKYVIAKSFYWVLLNEML